jgi:hypothetical protein
MKHSNYIYLLLLLLIVVIIIIYIYQKNNENREGFGTKYYRPHYRRFRKLMNDYIFYYIR